MAQVAELLGNASVTQALTAASGKEPFHLAPLPYAYDALEPVIGKEALVWHHDVLHRSYVDKLNAVVTGVAKKSETSPTQQTPSIGGQSLDAIFANLSRWPEDLRGDVRFNGGGHWNHTFLWSVMTDKKEDHELTPQVLHALEASFASLDLFKSDFIKAGVEAANGGWLWLLRSPEGKLLITLTTDNDNPLMDVCAVTGVPLLVCDLSEHAYVIKFKGQREEFLKKFLAIVNWARVDAVFTGTRPESHSGNHAGNHAGNH